MWEDGKNVCESSPLLNVTLVFVNFTFHCCSKRLNDLRAFHILVKRFCTFCPPGERFEDCLSGLIARKMLLLWKNLDV